MRFLFEQPELQRALAEARNTEALEEAFYGIGQLSERFRAPDIYGRRLFAKSLDDLTPRVATRLRLQDLPRGVKSNDNVCILATQFYRTGGHTRVVADIIQRLQPDGAALLVTDTYREQRVGQFFREGSPRTHLEERAFMLCTAPTLVERVLETYMKLAAMRPTRIIMATHPMDIVGVIAAWPFRDVVEFLHHADHFPSLGATLPFSAHVDLTYTCHLACCEAGLAPTYAGMASPGAMTPAPASAAPDRALRIATCGSPHKYRGGGRHRWADYAIAALREPGSELIHVGPTDEALIQELTGALTAASIPLDRYILANFQPSLPDELAKYGVDVYLSSYPETGGKANLEAMMSGVPAIVPLDDTLPPLIQYRSPLPRWVPVASPDALPAAIAQAKALRAQFGGGADQAALARETARFDDYVAMRPIAPLSSGERLP
ncbi:hypothetical protein [Phenylobacterium sp.]|uniref:hypothetical protein n=1 Tax=Phenylobacterium sp. TaxID=1871053 RepID=UPI0025EDEB28|nr:hypothetical protein [Phenylobacterium sp.]